MAKQKQHAPDEFVFTREASNSGTLTYRCIELSISSQSDYFSESELGLIRLIVKVANDMNRIGEANKRRSG